MRESSPPSGQSGPVSSQEEAAEIFKWVQSLDGSLGDPAPGDTHVWRPPQAPLSRKDRMERARRELAQYRSDGLLQ